MRNKAALIPAAVLALIAGAATITATSTSAVANNLNNAAPAIGAMAPEFAFKDTEGETHALEDYRGNIVVLDFWATWCGPCKRVMPEMQKLHEDYKDRGVVVIGMNGNERGGDPAAYMEKQGYDYQLLLETESSWQDYGIRGIPAFFVIAPDGKLVWSGTGAQKSTHDNLIRAVKRQLANMPT